MSKGGGGGGGQSTNTIQSAEPPKYIQPFLEQAAQASKDIYNKGPMPLYPNQTYAPINATQQQGLDATMRYGTAPQSPMTTDALNALDANVNSTPGQNPYLDKLLEQYGAKANTLVASNFNSGGRYGSGAHAAAAGDAITRATMPYLFDQYNKDQTNKLQSAAMLPNLVNTQATQDLNKAQAVGSVGDVYQSQDQNAINDAVARYQYANGGGASSALDQYIAELSSNPYSKGSTQSSSSTTNKNSGIGSTIGSVVSGLGTLGGLGSGMSSLFSAGNLFAAIPGAVSYASDAAAADAFASMLAMSDERLKENIVPVGQENGHNVYEFEYINGSGKRYRGVMAQEVLEKDPSAIIMDKSGYMAVDYGKIGVRFQEVRESASPNHAAAPASQGGLIEAGAAGCGDTIQGGGL